MSSPKPPGRPHDEEEKVQAHGLREAVHARDLVPAVLLGSMQAEGVAQAAAEEEAGGEVKISSQSEVGAAVHPYWCDSCGGSAPFTIPGCPVEHATDCERHGEDPMTVWKAAVDYCLKTGRGIP
jgi:hypothetical protein